MREKYDQVKQPYNFQKNQTSNSSYCQFCNFWLHYFNELKKIYLPCVFCQLLFLCSYFDCFILPYHAHCLLSFQVGSSWPTCQGGVQSSRQTENSRRCQNLFPVFSLQSLRSQLFRYFISAYKMFIGRCSHNLLNFLTPCFFPFCYCGLQPVCCHGDDEEWCFHSR